MFLSLKRTPTVFQASECPYWVRSCLVFLHLFLHLFLTFFQYIPNVIPYNHTFPYVNSVDAELEFFHAPIFSNFREFEHYSIVIAIESECVPSRTRFIIRVVVNHLVIFKRCKRFIKEELPILFNFFGLSPKSCLYVFIFFCQIEFHNKVLQKILLGFYSIIAYVFIVKKNTHCISGECLSLFQSVLLYKPFEYFTNDQYYC